MGKQVMVLNGSPRANGNTEALSDALIRGAQKAGHTASKYNIRSMEIKPCLGCYQCVAGKGNPCVQKDDMQEIYDALNQADVVVFSSPLYWWHLTAQMKTVIDRIFGLAAANGMKILKKETVLLIAAEDTAEENFEQIIPYYQTCLVKNLNWDDRGMILAGGVNMPGDVEKTEYMEEAEALGASL
ncbi:flavodoxin family protein [Christensenellaceae bacterium OttesenSCG-928-K19]|nr:flavodoxin family protein [Christensenellaceae bacterium OttesenSCG-928-K19]